MIETLVQFGVAGLMGVLWVWERAHSRRRERQLTEAHGLLMSQERQLEVLVDTVRRNTEAMVRLERTQERMLRLLGRMGRTQNTNRRAA